MEEVKKIIKQLRSTSKKKVKFLKNNLPQSSLISNHSERCGSQQYIQTLIYKNTFGSSGRPKIQFLTSMELLDIEINEDPDVKALGGLEVVARRRLPFEMVKAGNVKNVKLNESGDYMKFEHFNRFDHTFVMNMESLEI